LFNQSGIQNIMKRKLCLYWTHIDIFILPSFPKKIQNYLHSICIILGITSILGSIWESIGMLYENM
jgi:hypothetical protein